MLTRHRKRLNRRARTLTSTPVRFADFAFEQDVRYDCDGVFLTTCGCCDPVQRLSITSIDLGPITVTEL